MGARQNSLPEQDIRPALEDRVLLITRELDAAVADVYAAFTQADQLLQWWSPENFSSTQCAVDVRIGGHYRIGIRSPEGVEHVMSGRYREVQPNERLVFSFAWEMDGRPGPETLVTVTFTAQGKGTRLVFRQAFFSSVQERDSHQQGWSGCLDKLQRHLAG